MVLAIKNPFYYKVENGLTKLFQHAAASVSNCNSKISYPFLDSPAVFNEEEKNFSFMPCKALFLLKLGLVRWTVNWV